MLRMQMMKLMLNCFQNCLRVFEMFVGFCHMGQKCPTHNQSQEQGKDDSFHFFLSNKQIQIFHLYIYPQILIMLRTIAGRFSKISEKPPNLRAFLDQTSKSGAQQGEQKVNTIRVRRPKRSFQMEVIIDQRGEFQSFSPSQKNYHEFMKRQFQDQQKVQNFHNYEYTRGQDYIDNVPIDQYYEYKVSDYQKNLQMRKEEIESLKKQYQEEVDPRPYSRSKLKRMINAYENSKNQFERQQFFQYLLNYPGNPQDNLEQFQKYAEEKMPESMKEELGQYKETIQTGQSRGVNSANRVEILSANRDFKIPTRQNISQILNEFRTTLHKLPIMSYYSKLPATPNTLFDVFHIWMNKYIQWMNFKHYHDGLTREQYLDEQGQIGRKMFLQINDGSEWIQHKPKIYSLYPYYRMLPKVARDNPGVRTMFLGLEHSQPDLSYREKQEALNYTARHCLPMDEMTSWMMEKHTQRIKFKPDPEMIDKMHTMPAQYTWDINQFMEQIRLQNLRNQALGVTKKKTKNYPPDPESFKKTDSHLPLLPVDYYDNDDGFWDQIISEKLKMYQEAQPILKKFQYLRH